MPLLSNSPCGPCEGTYVASYGRTLWNAHSVSCMLCTRITQAKDGSLNMVHRLAHLDMDKLRKLTANARKGFVQSAGDLKLAFDQPDFSRQDVADLLEEVRRRTSKSCSRFPWTVGLTRVCGCSCWTTGTNPSKQ